MVWESLRYIAESYFHQDYDLEAPTALGVVRKFASSERDTLRSAVISDLDKALAGSDTEEDLANLWIHELGASYEPEQDGISYRQWFEQMRAVLSE